MANYCIKATLAVRHGLGFRVVRKTGFEDQGLGQQSVPTSL